MIQPLYRMNVEVEWPVNPLELGFSNRFKDYTITHINTNDKTKEIWIVSYSCICNCGDGNSCNTLRDVAYVGQLSEEIKRRLLEKMPGYKLQGWNWNSGSRA